MRSSWMCRAIACALFSLLIGTAPASAQITGISDQHIDTWSNSANAYISAFGSQVAQVRYQPPWDVGTYPTSDPRFQAVDAWITRANQLGKRILITFDRPHNCDSGHPGCPPPSVAAYTAAVRAFRLHWPSITEFTAWNEPNHHLVGTDGIDNNPAGNPARAAAYWNALNQECSIPSSTGVTCQVAAGDLLEGTGNYLVNYKASLGATPTVWAFHPYRAVNSGDRSGVNAFLAGTDNKPVWFTEVGAFNCVDGTVFGDASQNTAANRLVSLMNDTAARVQRTYYYYFSSNAPDCIFGTALLNPDGSPRPALATLFPVLLQTATPPTIGVLNPNGHVNVKTGSINAAWIDEGAGNQAVSVASNPVDGPLLAVLSSGHINVKQGNLSGAWIDEGGGFQGMSVASDPVHGPLLAALGTDGNVYAKQGNLFGAWIWETAGSQAVSVASDPVHGPLLAVLSSGHINVKQGNLSGAWIDEGGGFQGMSVASDPVHGPLLAALGTDGNVYVKQGNLSGPWINEGGGNQSVGIASDPINGPLLAVLNNGHIKIKQRDLSGVWIDEGGGFQGMSVASDPVHGPLLAALAAGGNVYVKQGNLSGAWTDQGTAATAVSVTG